MTGLGKRLTVVTAACVLIGLAAVVAAWRDPEGGRFTVLATAAGWPWAWAVFEGGLVWRRGRAMQSSGLEHALAIYAAGAAAAVLIGALTFAVWGVELRGGFQLTCGPLEPLCAAFTCMALACVMCGWTLGLVFPALLPPAAAWTSAQLLGTRPPSRASMQAAVAVTTACWLVVLLTGLVLASA
ncbi:MAG: hypothetical protein OXS47_11725 [Chloroflexota bacterium]|nr:hypothetical protein [Chloroflexota bacterium]